MSDRTPTIDERITAYLSGGGLFNPEFAHHDAVRDLLIDCRAELAEAVEALKEIKRSAKASVNTLSRDVFDWREDMDEIIRKADAVLAKHKASS